MFYNQDNKIAVEEVKKQIMTAHNTLLKAINNDDVLNDEYDRKQLRKIRDMNIKTWLLITELEMRNMIWSMQLMILTIK